MAEKKYINPANPGAVPASHAPKGRGIQFTKSVRDIRMEDADTEEILERYRTPPSDEDDGADAGAAQKQKKLGNTRVSTGIQRLSADRLAIQHNPSLKDGELLATGSGTSTNYEAAKPASRDGASVASDPSARLSSHLRGLDASRHQKGTGRKGWKR